MYFIDKLALRAGHEKDEDEADTVGCCTLKVRPARHAHAHTHAHSYEYRAACAHAGARARPPAHWSFFPACFLSVRQQGHGPESHSRPL
jgi:hypothetical protein